MATIFLAGASGVIGRPTAEILIKEGHTVYGTTRSVEKAAELEKMGVKPVIMDVFDAERVNQIVAEIQPEIVLHQLTDLPDGLAQEQMAAALVRNARIRDEGTRNLVRAAENAGVKKVIAQSICFVYAPSNKMPVDESAPLLDFSEPIYGETAQAVYSLEQQIMHGNFIGIVLRNGFLYGKGTGFDIPVDFAPPVHVEAAARAIVLAIEHDEKESVIFNIANDDPRVTSAKAKRELGWSPNMRLKNPHISA
ncbi:NAD-dependent epimerase/dehydratase family protein [Neisseriaceae bacterium B1]